jgi:hypothetical protein
MIHRPAPTSAGRPFAAGEKDVGELAVTMSQPSWDLPC